MTLPAAPVPINAVAVWTVVAGMVFSVGGCDVAEPPAANREARAAPNGDEPPFLRVPAGAALPGLPVASDVSEIALRLAPPWTASPKCVVTVTAPAEIEGLLAQLRRIDWSQKGTGLETIGLETPEIELTIRESSGPRRDYALWWDGTGFVDNVTTRLLEADLAGLRRLIRDGLIRRLAADQAQSAPVKSRPLRVPRGGDVPALPHPDDAEVTLQVSAPGATAPRCVLRVTSRPHVANILGHLGRVDMSQTGTPLERVQLLAPDVTLLVHEGPEVHREYAFYWNEASFVDGVTNRLLVADVSGLRTMVVDALVLELAELQSRTKPTALDRENRPKTCHIGCHWRLARQWRSVDDQSQPTSAIATESGESDVFNANHAFSLAGKPPVAPNTFAPFDFHVLAL